MGLEGKDVGLGVEAKGSHAKPEHGATEEDGAREKSTAADSNMDCSGNKEAPPHVVAATVVEEARSSVLLEKAVQDTSSLATLETGLSADEVISGCRTKFDDKVVAAVGGKGSASERPPPDNKFAERSMEDGEDGICVFRALWER